jgi:hypothetical protein
MGFIASNPMALPACEQLKEVLFTPWLRRKFLD